MIFSMPSRFRLAIFLRAILFMMLSLGLTHQLLAMSLDKEEQKSVVAKKRRKAKRSQPKSRIASGIADIQLASELECGRRAFERLDELYAQVFIKVQKLDELGVPGQEAYTNLYEFLTAPHKAEEIVSVLEHRIKRKLSDRELGKIAKMRRPSLPDAIRSLGDLKTIDAQKAYELILETAPMTGDEIHNLLDLGASQTKSGFLINARTGKTYGDPFTLNSDFHQLARAISESHRHVVETNSIDLLTGPLSDSLLSAIREFGPDAEEIVSDARVISEIRRHFVFLSRISMPISFRPGTVDFRPNAISTAGAPVNPVNFTGIVWELLKNLNFVIMSNHYFADHGSSLTNSLMVAPFAVTYWGNYNWSAGGVGWWMSYSDKYLGIGASYTQNFAKGTFWSNGAPTWVMYGGTISGWRNNLTIGLSFATALSSTVGIGASVTGTILRDHDVYYKGQYPLDGRFAEIRGLHKIEIDDRKGIALQETISANFSNAQVPIMVAFRAGQEWTTRRIFRTHVDLEKTQAMLSESDIPGILFIFGKQIKETTLPTFMQPDSFKVGDEFIETKIGRLSGAFVVGLQSQLPIGAVRAGMTADLTAEFELALRRLPGNFFEVSVEPKRIYELGAFASILNTVGVGVVKNITMARKQSFIFDFNVADARAAYYQLVKKGILPLNSNIEVYQEERGPEYLLTEFRNHNEKLKDKGIALSFIEHVDVSSEKIHAGFDSRLLRGVVDLANIVDRHTREEHARLNLRFDGVDREFMTADSSSLASNGIVSIKRSTFGFRKSKGQGFSGRSNQDIYVTHCRIHTKDDYARTFANKWDFGSLLIHAQIEDNLIKGDEENEMVDDINRKFSTFIGPFKKSDSHQPRVVNLERELTIIDLLRLTQPDVRERCQAASSITGVSERELSRLLDKMKDKHPDHQALLIKTFIEHQSGASGFAAIHQLLGARAEDLHIRSEAGYNATIAGAKKFVASFADEQSELKDGRVDLHSFDTRKERKQIKKYYQKARFFLGEIDAQLRLLEDDQFLIDADSEWNTVLGKDKVTDLVRRGVWEDKKSRRAGLVSARQTIRQQLNLQKQGYDGAEIAALYKIAGRDLLPFRDLGERLLMKYQDEPLVPGLSKSKLRSRYAAVKDMVRKINDRIKHLEKDAVMIEMDKAFVDDSIVELTEMRARLAALIDTRNMEVAHVTSIRKKVGARDFDEVNSFVEFLNEASLHDPSGLGEI